MVRNGDVGGTGNKTLCAFGKPKRDLCLKQGPWKKESQRAVMGRRDCKA